MRLLPSARGENHRQASANHLSHAVERKPQCVRVLAEHRLNAVPSHRSKVGVIDTRRPQVRYERVPHLVRSDIYATRLLRRLPDIAVEFRSRQSLPLGVGNSSRVSMRLGIFLIRAANPGGQGTSRPGDGSPWSVLVPPGFRLRGQCVERGTHPSQDRLALAGEPRRGACPCPRRCGAWAPSAHQPQRRRRASART